MEYKDKRRSFLISNLYFVLEHSWFNNFMLVLGIQQSDIHQNIHKNILKIIFLFRLERMIF